MRLIYLESRKGILRRSVCIALFLFMIMDLVKIGTEFSAGKIREVTANSDNMRDTYNQIYKKVKGRLTSENVSFVVDEYNRLLQETADGTYSRDWQENTYSGHIFGDFYIFHKYFYPSMSYSVNYGNNMEKTITQAEKDRTLYESVGNTADAARCRYFLEHYKGRSITQYFHYDVWEALLRYDFSDLLILLLIILGIAPIFTREKENGMDLLLCSSKKGKGALFIAKCGSIIFFVAALTVLFAVINLLFFGILFGFEGVQSPLYAIENYQYTPYEGSILSFYFLCTITKTGGFCGIALFLSFLSSRSKKTIYPCLVGAVVGSVLNYFSGWVLSEVWWKKLLSLISPLSLTRYHELMSGLYGFGIGGFYILQVYIMFFVQAALWAVLILAVGRKSCCELN